VAVSAGHDGKLGRDVLELQCSRLAAAFGEIFWSGRARIARDKHRVSQPI